MRQLLIIMALFFLLVQSCAKKEENEPFSVVSSIPQIQLEALSADRVQQFDPLTFYIRYKDGNGDIGTTDADLMSLEILDTRDEILHSYHIPPQSPVEGIAITGVLVVELENLILIDQENQEEQVIFEIRLKDKRDNWSNVIQTPAVNIIK